MKTLDAAKGKWKGILLQLGVDRSFLTGNHSPCPLCGGHDRFRFDNKHGNGSYICGQCGAGTGMQLLQRLNGWDFATAASEVDKVLGNVSMDTVKPAMEEEKRRELLRKLYLASKPITLEDQAGRYLTSRLGQYWKPCEDLRYAPECPAPDGVKRPALLAIVRGADGEAVNIHRTFLGPNGKADMSNPRAMMPGAIPEGSAVRLMTAGTVLGIAEGIETAFAAAKRFSVPVWSAINSTMLGKWRPPEGVETVMVFGDNDTKFGGQAVAYGLAHRLAVKGYKTDVYIPEIEGADWADV